MSKIRCASMALAVVFCVGIIDSQAQTTQSSQDKPANITTRAINLKYADPYQIKSTLDPIAKAGGTILTVDDRNKILLIAGNPDRISEIESLISRLDTAPVPDKSIEITTYLLLAGDEVAPSQNIPTALEPALKQLRATFNYKSYQLLDTVFLRNRTGRGGSTSGMLTMPGTDAKGEPVVVKGASPGSYQFLYDRSYLTREEKGDVIHLSGLRLSVSSAGTIQTDLDLRSGQTVVLGKTSIGAGGTGLIAIISAKIVD